MLFRSVPDPAASSTALCCSPVCGDGGVEEGGAEEGRDQSSAPASPWAKELLSSAASSQKVHLQEALQKLL